MRFQKDVQNKLRDIRLEEFLHHFQLESVSKCIHRFPPSNLKTFRKEQNVEGPSGRSAAFQISPKPPPANRFLSLYRECNSKTSVDVSALFGMEEGDGKASCLGNVPKARMRLGSTVSKKRGAAQDSGRTGLSVGVVSIHSETAPKGAFFLSSLFRTSTLQTSFSNVLSL